MLIEEINTTYTQRHMFSLFFMCCMSCIRIPYHIKLLCPILVTMVKSIILLLTFSFHYWSAAGQPFFYLSKKALLPKSGHKLSYLEQLSLKSMLKFNLKGTDEDVEILTLLSFVLRKRRLFGTIWCFVNLSKDNYLPDFEKCPAPSSHLNKSVLSSVFISRSFAMNLAGSEYSTRGSVALCQKLRDYK